MEKEYFVREYLEGDENEIVSLLQLAFDKWPFYDTNYSSVDYWLWKYIENPCNIINVSCAVNDGKIVGVGHDVPLRIKINNVTFQGAYSTDLGVNPEFRRLGIANSLSKSIISGREEQGIQFYYFVTENPIWKNRSERAGRSYIPHKILTLERIRDIDLHVKMRRQKNPWRAKARHTTTSLANKIQNIFDPKYVNNNIKIINVKKFEPSINSFWNEVKEGHDFILERKMDYLNWRYDNNRVGNYQIRIAKLNRKTVGFIVLRINRLEDYHIGYIVDLLTLPNRLDAFEMLVRDAICYFNTNKINLIKYLTIENNQKTRILKRHGFLSNVSHQWFFYGWSKKEFAQLENISADRFHFMYGDLTGI